GAHQGGGQQHQHANRENTHGTREIAVPRGVEPLVHALWLLPPYRRGCHTDQWYPAHPSPRSSTKQSARSERPTKNAMLVGMALLLAYSGFRTLLQGDFDIHTGGKVETHERVNGLVSGVDDVHEPLMSAHFELVARRLVDVRRTQDVIATNPRGQWDRTAHNRTGALGGIHDFGGRLVDEFVVVRFQTDADFLVFHGNS